jgi:hypothetical protein
VRCSDKFARDVEAFHPISFGVSLFHFLLTRSRQHRGVAFSLGEGRECKTKAVTSPRWRLFANPMNLGTVRARASRERKWLALKVEYLTGQANNPKNSAACR